MTIKTLHDQPYYDIMMCEDTQCAILIWKPTTIDITDEEFKEAVRHFADAVEAQQIYNIAVDMRQYSNDAKAPSPEVIGSWRSQEIIPRYNQAGIRKFAYLITPVEVQGPQLCKPVRNPGESFESAVFDEEDKMQIWLKSQD